MPYPINQRAHQFNSIQSVPVSFGLWDTALKFLSPGPRNDVTDHLVLQGHPDLEIRKGGGGGGGGVSQKIFFGPLGLRLV